MRDGTAYTPITATGTTSPIGNNITIDNVHNNNDVETLNSVVINEDNAYIDPGEQLKQAYVNMSSVYTNENNPALAAQRSGWLINNQDFSVNKNGDSFYLFNNLNAIGRGRDITAGPEVEKMVAANIENGKSLATLREFEGLYPKEDGWTLTNAGSYVNAINTRTCQYGKINPTGEFVPA